MTSVACSLAFAAASILTAAPDADRAVTRQLWRDPGDISRKDLFWGAGSRDRAPQPPFTFVKEDESGSKPKVIVTDAAGSRWNVKFDDLRNSRGLEVPGEVAATRIAWALGYFVDENYFIVHGVVNGLGVLKRARIAFDAHGRFASARFERRPEHVDHLETRWTLEDNPFTGTRELDGLVITAALLSNWDVQKDNLAIVRVRTAGTFEDRYIVSDWGSSFGRVNEGDDRPLSRWRLADYVSDTGFVRGPEDGRLEIRYRPGRSGLYTVPIEHARWIAGLASRLSHRQLERAFLAAGATSPDAAGFATRLLAKIRELGQAAGRTADTRSR